MYQFYYADYKKKIERPELVKDIRDYFEITGVRPSMWEEHCLECSAPACFQSCPHYIARSDGRCKRFENGIYMYRHEKACCEHAARITFRPWGNLMTIVFPAIISEKEILRMTEENDKLGNHFRKLLKSHLPVKAKWGEIRTREYLRRRNLRNMKPAPTKPDAFLFHGYSHMGHTFQLLLEFYDDSTPVYKTSLQIAPGENLQILDGDAFANICFKPGTLLKIYPENDLEAEIDLFWCDFVSGKRKLSAETISSDEIKIPSEKVKCVVWDLDQTIWNGILIETEYPDELQLREGILEAIHTLDAKGIIQSVASKNDYDMAWPVVEKLGLSEYFLYPQIHWGAKSASMEQIAKLLNIGIDSLALIDDSSYERGQVQNQLPQTRAYDVAELSDVLSRPEFEVPITEESKNRRQMYREEENRNQMLTVSGDDTIAFLRKCHLTTTLFEPMTEEEIQRCYELTVRTNQLNLSGKKYTNEEFQKILSKEGHRNFAFSCKDDFGSYGIVGYGQYCIQEGQIVFTEFAMSCRVAGKYVESALFEAILEKEGCEKGNFHVQKTKKNILLRRTLKDIGFQIEKEAEDRIWYVFYKELEHADVVQVSWRVVGQE